MSWRRVYRLIFMSELLKHCLNLYLLFVLKLILSAFLFHRIAWLVGWALVLDYTIGGSAIARGITPNLVFLFELYVFVVSCRFNSDWCFLLF